jgi:hypothetical protein
MTDVTRRGVHVQDSRGFRKVTDAAVAIIELRKLHRLYIRCCGSRFRYVPFGALLIPGWVYDPAADKVTAVIDQIESK